MKTITNIIYSAFALFAFACFALSPTAQAVTPAPDGFYPNANTAEGEDALFSLTTGDSNTAIGSGALYSNSTGARNTAIGAFALNSNTTGGGNTATGRGALANSTTHNFNTADGYNALFFNTTSGHNMASGGFALFHNTTGNSNTASGYAALSSLTSGDGNTAVGYSAGENLTSGGNNIYVGNLGGAGEANTIRIGNLVAATDSNGLPHPVHTATYIAGIMGKTTPMGSPVFINAKGQLGTATSSARFKTEIKPMDKTSEAILALKPVTFRYKKDIDPDGSPQFGLVAEDVAKVNPDLVVRDADGKVYTVRYEAVNAMLLNEFLKEYRKVQEQAATITELKSTVAQQQEGMKVFTATLKEQASQIQKVSAQLELQKPPAQTVVNNQ